MSDLNMIRRCLVCGAGNPADAVRCHRCDVDLPMARAKEQAARDARLAEEKQRLAAASAPPSSPLSGILTSLRKLFGLKAKEGVSAQGGDGNADLDEHLDYLKTITQPAILLQKTPEKHFSKLGGLPTLPPTLPWPTRNEIPLAFLAQLDLSQLPRIETDSPLPAAGLLFFFYDNQEQPWGFDPKDCDGWQVLYSTSAVTACAEAAVPAGLDANDIFAEQFFTSMPIHTFPPSDDERIEALDLTEEQLDAYCERSSMVFHGQPAHQLLGYPWPEQLNNDMALECQLVSHGLYCGNVSGYNNPTAKILEEGQADWVLLFQFATDDDAEMMWGDCGKLYFWIRKDDLAVPRFDKCWMILQCG